YAAPGEVVIIDLPPHAKGFTAQIGAWTDDLSGKASPKRFPVVYSRQTLVAGQRNYVRNLFGGNIYIRTQFPVKEPVTMVFSNVCKSPDFFIGKTDEAAWKQEIMNTSVPWFEFVTKSVIFTLPTERMKNLLTRNPGFNMTENAKGWEDIVALDYNQWMGLSDTASDPRDLQIDLPSRYVLDIEISAGWGHNGYPVMAYDDPEWFNSAMDGNRPVSMWGALHELGHNVQQGSTWSWSGLGETTRNLFSFKRAERMGIPYKNLHSNDWVQEALDFAKNGTAQFDNANLSPFHKLVPFLQIYHKAVRYDGQDDGWGFMGYLYRRARHAERLSMTDLDKRDFLYEALCEYTGKDYGIFFEAWKIPISSYSRDKM
ncbi:MAG: M60 family metallopeptidase, partial [Gallicola sp.]|nr:M60 family metallopeptidase [Gallicola sp.]